MKWGGVGEGRKTNCRRMYKQDLRKSMPGMFKEQQKLTLIEEEGSKR